MGKQKTIIVIYELGQIAQVLSYLEDEKISLETCTIVPFEFEIEHELARRGIPYTSFTHFIPIEEEFADVIAAAQNAARHFHAHPAMRFFTYREVNLGEVFEPMIDSYLQYLGRFVRVFERVIDLSGTGGLVVPYSIQQPPTSGAALVPFEFRAVVDAARLVGKQKGVAIETIGTPPNLPQEIRRAPRRLATLGLAAYNKLMSLIPSRPLKIYASEYWWHIDSFIEKMDDVELVFMERKEIKNIPWRQLLKHRVRFLHPADAISTAMQRDIDKTVRAFSVGWHAAREEVQEVFDTTSGITLWPVVEKALTYLIETQSSRALVDIEGFFDILRKEHPDKVLLRASIGGTQQHFFIATQVARQLGIPSIELQHAGAVVDPRSVHSRLAASYLAAYGPLTRDILVRNHGYAPERIRPVGSPRLDHYSHERSDLIQNRAEFLRGLGLDPLRPVVLAAVPYPGALPTFFSSQQVAVFFQTFRSVQKELPELQFIFKFRPGNFSQFYQDYIREIFADGGTVATNSGDLLSLIVASDIACTGNSTVVYEVMLSERPLILFPWRRYDTYSLDIYSRAAPVAFTAEELAECLRQFLNKEDAMKAVNRQNLFLSEQYRFDGKASERIKALLREELLPLP